MDVVEGPQGVELGGYPSCVPEKTKSHEPFGSRPRDLSSEIPLSLADVQRGIARRPSSARRGRPRIHIDQETVV